jgi:glucose-1-phosphate thymidylyltransferase
MVQPHNRVGIVLAGGKGTRLYPLTKVVSKQLLPVYNKPMIFYPIQTLIETGHKEIIIISNPEDKKKFKELIEDSFKNIDFKFLIQKSPKGLPDAFSVSQDHIRNRETTLILGDNLINIYSTNIDFFKDGCSIFLKEVDNPQELGVANIKNKKIIKIIEKPKNPSSNLAIIGLYFFDKTVLEKVKKLKPSKRGELEIVDLIRQYLNEENLNFYQLQEKESWYDAGNFKNLYKANSYYFHLSND